MLDVGARWSSVISRIALILLQCKRLQCAAPTGAGGGDLFSRFCVKRKILCLCGSVLSKPSL